jgi:hypothetical protein
LQLGQPQIQRDASAGKSASRPHARSTSCRWRLVASVPGHTGPIASFIVWPDGNRAWLCWRYPWLCDNWCFPFSQAFTLLGSAAKALGVVTANALAVTIGQ